jgi:hypothetical protein
MPISRRAFLKFAAIGTVATGLIVTVGHWTYAPLRTWLFRLRSDVPVGRLDVATGKTLMAAVDTLIGVPFEQAHYAEFFAWYAARIPGFRGLYERSATMLDAKAALAGAASFGALGYEDRRLVLDDLLKFQGGRLRKLWATMVTRDAVLFDRYVVEPVLNLYSETDVWVHLGYESWRGQPRGLIRYTRPPRAAGQTLPRA